MSVVTRRVRVAVGIGALLLGGSVVGASAAQAAPAAPAKPYGTVTTQNGTNVRAYPSTDSSVKDVLEYKEQVGLDCKVNAQNIQGNTVWYKLRGSERWVSARYVDNTGSVPLCKDKFPSAQSHSEESRKADG
ncbi:SH3 domain-containing protein [Streptomyces sp. NPDC005438]|uniref:SH3 domain-containing protein n=1 Tax=Streptomyces sp. NPDC005438 TaxID=3156880 RepID=UPI0033ADE6E0